jgi:hypothetical protein
MVGTTTIEHDYKLRAAVTFHQNLKTVMPHIGSPLVSLLGGSPKT